MNTTSNHEPRPIPPRRRGLARAELAALLLVLAIALAVVLPAAARLRGLSGTDASLDNLAQLGLAHAVYAADWSGRQATVVIDELSLYGSSAPQAVANYDAVQGEPHPPVLFGWSQFGDVIGLAGYYFQGSSNPGVLMPISFDSAFGSFRFANTRPLHDYVDGRYYSSTWYAPNDVAAHAAAAPSFDEPDEYDFDGTTGALPAWSSYCLSPAAMYGRDILRAPSLGGWQDPFTVGLAFQSPPLDAALYPDLKTHMVEHHWVQSPPGLCNPAFGTQGTYLGCEPYYFNHGIDSAPTTLFYDGHVRLLPNSEVQASDRQIMTQTGGVDGLWSRDTPLGADGYLLDFAYDAVVDVSHHVLTTGGIWGRDTLGPDAGAPERGRVGTDAAAPNGQATADQRPRLRAGATTMATMSVTRVSSVGCFALAALAGGLRAQVDEPHHWACPDGGALNDPSCWLEDGSPVPDGVAVFDLDATYDVDVASGDRLRRLLVHAGTVVFDGSSVITQLLPAAEAACVIGGVSGATAAFRRGLVAYTVVLGAQPGASGAIELADPSGVLISFQANTQLVVGAAGHGALTATGAFTAGRLILVRCGQLVMARDAGSQGAVELLGVDCQVVGGQAIVGRRGAAVLQVGDAAQFNGPLMHVGLYETATALVDVHGADTQLDFDGLVVGAAGLGELIVRDGAAASTAYSTQIGVVDTSAASGSHVSVRDHGSLLSVGLDLYLGIDGGGALRLADDGHASVAGNVFRSDHPASGVRVRIGAPGHYPPGEPALEAGGATPPGLAVRVGLSDGYRPAAGDTFALVGAGTLGPVDLAFEGAAADVRWTSTVIDGELRITAVTPDVDGDGDVDADDLLEVILAWGACADPPVPCPADVDGDGAVGADDLVAVVLAWTSPRGSEQAHRPAAQQEGAERVRAST